MQQLPSLANQYHVEHVGHLLISFRQLLGYDLADQSKNSFAKDVFEAPFVVVSHGLTEDPIFNYGNRIALSLFEMGWSDFTSMPSQKSAEPVNREERARLLETVSRQGYIDDYAGVRISATGKRFFIPKAIVWNVYGSNGGRVGQAATFSRWQYL